MWNFFWFTKKKKNSKTYMRQQQKTAARSKAMQRRKKQQSSKQNQAVNKIEQSCKQQVQHKAEKTPKRHGQLGKQGSTTAAQEYKAVYDSKARTKHNSDNSKMASYQIAPSPISSSS